MPAVPERQLHRLYQHTVDPWNFRQSPYERNKFSTSIGFLGGRKFAGILEVGCGNGEFARLLAQHGDTYTGVDAVEVALQEARKAVPDGRFHRRFLPCDLPEGQYDLIVLSEILYFLDFAGIDALARQIGTRWPQANILSVNYLGPSGNPVQGHEAAARFRQALGASFACELWLRHPGYLLEKFVPGQGERATAAPQAAASRAATDGGAQPC